MVMTRKTGLASIVLLLLFVPGVATAQFWEFEVTGTLGPPDPTFNRPSTSFPPCVLSGNGTDVYYDVYTDFYPGGYAYVEMDGTIDEAVIAAYPAGTFNPASPCDDIYSVAGCVDLPFAVVAPVLEEEGWYDIVVTTCYNGDVGTYRLYMFAFLFMDGFDGGDLSQWSGTSGDVP